MTQDLLSRNSTSDTPVTDSQSLPFPFNQRSFCRFEPIEAGIEEARVLVVDNLLRDEDDLSEVALTEFGDSIGPQLKRERQIAGMAMENILANVARLVKRPSTFVTHISDVAAATTEFRPHAIVLSGTLRDFDYYKN